MQKVLIISYFFSPCSLTAGQRALGWANYLSEYGYYPTIISRRWDQPISTPEDALLSSGQEIIHEKNEKYEVFYLPYKATLRDRFYTRFSGSPLQKLSRVFTFFGLIAENFTHRALPYRNLYTFAKNWVKDNPDTKITIISGAPFNQFSFGYRLKKKLKMNWIADYRDDWSSPDITGTSGNGVLGKFINRLAARSEKKWVGSAVCITSVSGYYAEKIGKFVNRPSHVVLNGFELVVPAATASSSAYVLTYNGSLHYTQLVEGLLTVVERLITEDKLAIELNFPGLAFDPIQEERVLNASKNIQEFVHITPRIPKEQVLQIQANSDALIMLSHPGMKGIPSSKLYEYLPFEKPIIQYPNDGDIVEETLLDSGLGFSTSSTDELYERIKSLAEDKINGRANNLQPNKERIQSYSRKMQTKSLADLLNQLHAEL